MTIVTMNQTDENHLAKVKAEMQELGAPTIRAIYDGEIYWAIEGSHRLVAAHELGIEPQIIDIEYSDEEIVIQWDGQETTLVISELAHDLMRCRNDMHVLYFN
jgi:hypothetical protein